MPETPDIDDVVVVGERMQEVVGFEGSSGGSFSNLIPRWWTSIDFSGGRVGWTSSSPRKCSRTPTSQSRQRV